MPLRLKLEDWEKTYLIIAGLVFLLFLFILPEKHHPDSNYWSSWAAYIRTNGLTNIYSTDSNYFPAFHYLLYIYAYMQDNVDDIYANINYFKLYIFLFHIGSSYILMNIIQMISVKENIKFGVFYLLNIAVLYNTLVWGQIDEIISFFMILCLYFFLRNNPRFAIIAFLIGVNFKLQAIIFLPVILILALSHYWRKEKKTVLLDTLLIVGIQVLIFLPFIASGKLGLVFNELFGLIDSQPFISANAYNFWHFVIVGTTRFQYDGQEFIYFTYKQWGLILFFVISVFALFPLFFASLNAIFYNQKPKFNSNLVILSFGIIPLIFFFFCTQMHERYSHSAIVFIILYSIITKKWHLGFLVSLAYLLNMDGVLKGLSFLNYDMIIFKSRIIATIYSVVILLLFKEIFFIFLSERKLENN